ncbi:MAG: hypothetical protein GY953_43585 [bacterium]|nr:hypothetical protein [bacterium]
MHRLTPATARTIAQDEATRVVYGTLREAVRAGAVDEVSAPHSQRCTLVRC